MEVYARNQRPQKLSNVKMNLMFMNPRIKEKVSLGIEKMKTFRLGSVEYLELGAAANEFRLT